MPIELQFCDALALDSAEVQALWKEVCRLRGARDDVVSVRCVSADESQALNLRYRSKDTPTNVLTFTYEDEHDVALCVDVIEREADSKGMGIQDYAALVLVHGLLHATGMDHERSREEAAAMREAERNVLEATGYTVRHL